MGYLRTLSRIMNAAIFSFRYLKNPLIIFRIPFAEKIEVETLNNEKLTIPRTKLPALIEAFQAGWAYKNGIYIRDKFKLKITDPSILLESLQENYMKIPLRGKVVLDIGGFCGETSVFFIKEAGAKKVFVYEPIAQNYELITTNAKLNHLGNRVVAYNVGVSNTDGYETISSSAPPGSSGFGLPGKKHSIRVRTSSWNTVLKRHLKDGIFLAKVDCEGGERHLLAADKKLIVQIPHWVIETHSKEIEKAIIALFEELGYKKELRIRGNDQIGVFAFSR